MARKITEISLSQTFLGDFLISVHLIYARHLSTMASFAGVVVTEAIQHTIPNRLEPLNKQ